MGKQECKLAAKISKSNWTVQLALIRCGNQLHVCMATTTEFEGVSKAFAWALHPSSLVFMTNMDVTRYCATKCSIQGGFLRGEFLRRDMPAG